ncbi:3-oxoacyl-ACP reductase [Brachybacterium saurashtrense]|uniref:3-oxoacyl-ACP reductase n=1 Tax=Brachybacterium saurashtrense TaxID=556288 RepID=A0A345YPB6_9MICO|nr:3-oxoacyl-ACP reductase [Brachybacterium saurashtrense]AXK45768.1 3-oxoacyl-ACP reductase [Brachybacterium saurashtrense]RRR24786.1 3-oxoacyl-ACP reductase [Brachybacterium saurashtrense]
MTDAYTRFVRSAPGGALARQLGLPRPARLRRREGRPEPVLGPVVVLGDSAGADAIAHLLLEEGTDVRRRFEELRSVGSVILVMDELAAPSELGPLVLPLAGAMRSLAPGARVVTISRPAGAEEPARDAARGGVEGFLRSLAHEMRGGATANGVLVEDGVALDAPGVLGALRFFLSARSAFVTGQFLTVSSAAGGETENRSLPLAGRTALVTGAARGIGAAIARTLAADGARVVVLDVPGAGTELSRLANELRAVPIQLDVISDGAGERLVAFLRERGLTLDAVVLNAGITRDKLLANMTPERWDPVLAVNISSQIALTEALLEAGDVLGEAPRVVSLASTSGIAGNRGQTNYAASKAGVMAFVDALAARLEAVGGTANAVAPGFIETEMTAKIPAVTREIARRMNSLQQGGLPVDVAEAIAFLCSAEAGGIRGETLRVCGQNLVGR